jgi:hypothetical protein
VTKLACQYALLRFRPFVETGEFAVVGVALLCPEGRFFGYKLLGKYGRVTRFFHQLDRKVYLNGVALFKEELDRFAGHVRQEALDGRKRTPNIEMAVRLFGELTRPRDAMLQFDDRRVVLAADPKAKLAELFDHYVERDFATKAYQERLLENSVRRVLYHADTLIGMTFQQAKVGTPDFLVNFPFVRRTDQKIDSIIKPLYLGHDDPTRVLNHGGQWVDKINRLRRRNALPERVLFPLAAPLPGAKAFAAYEEIRDDLVRVDVRVVSASDEGEIVAFATAGAFDPS